MRPIASPLLAVALLGPGAPAQPEDHTRVPIDAGAICDALRDSYARDNLEERVILSVTRSGVTRSEPITLRIWPGPMKNQPPTFQLLLGPLIVWNDSDTLFVIHQRDDATLLTEPIGDDGPLAAIRRAMPPIPAPDVVLALAEGRGCPTSLPFAPTIQWSDAIVNAETRPAQAHLVGQGEHDERVELIADLEPPALRWFVIENNDEDLRIEGEVRRSPAPDGPTIMDVSNRRRVSSLAELAPVESALHAGDTLPPMMVQPADRASPGVAAPLKPIRGPAIIILFKQWDRDVPAAIAAAQQATSDSREYAIWPVAVVDLTQSGGDTRARIDAIKPKLGPLPLYYSTSPDRTIERVALHAVVALIVVDDRQTVRMAERIDNFTVLDEPGVMVARIAAAITPR